MSVTQSVTKAIRSKLYTEDQKTISYFMMCLGTKISPKEDVTTKREELRSQLKKGYDYLIKRLYADTDPLQSETIKDLNTLYTILDTFLKEPPDASAGTKLIHKAQKSNLMFTFPELKKLIAFYKQLELEKVRELPADYYDSKIDLQKDSGGYSTQVVNKYDLPGHMRNLFKNESFDHAVIMLDGQLYSFPKTFDSGDAFYYTDSMDFHAKLDSRLRSFKRAKKNKHSKQIEGLIIAEMVGRDILEPLDLLILPSQTICGMLRSEITAKWELNNVKYEEKFTSLRLVLTVDSVSVYRSRYNVRELRGEVDIYVCVDNNEL